MGMRWTVRSRHDCWDVDRPDGTWSATFIYWSDALRYANQRAAAWTAAANAVSSLSAHRRPLLGARRQMGTAVTDLLYRLWWTFTLKRKCACCHHRHPTTDWAYWRGGLWLCAPCDHSVHPTCRCSKAPVR